MFNELLQRYPVLDFCKEEIKASADALINCYENGGKVLICGNGGKLKEVSDICICVPETETFKVQELHLPVYHYLCAAVEAHFFES